MADETSLSAAARARVVAAWAEAIGASPGNLHRQGWTIVERGDLDAVVVVKVDGVGLVAAPPSVIGIIRHLAPGVLLDAVALATALPTGARAIGTADLLFAERPPAPGDRVVRPAASDDLVSIRARVTEAEWAESGIDALTRSWVSTDPTGHPVAVAGFAPWRSELAQLGVITTAAARGSGAGAAGAGAATRAALADGLIAQWRSRQGNEASLRLAHRLGFTALGLQASVALSA